MQYICKVFTSGRIVFTVIFVLVFAAGLLWSYRKDKAVNALHFKNSYKVLIALVAFVSLLFLIVKMRKFL